MKNCALFFLFVFVCCYTTVFAQCNNVALLKPVTTSGVYLSNTPAKAVNGNCGDLWNSGSFAPQFFEVDLLSNYTINNINIMFSMSPNGNVNHEILTSPDMVTWTVVDNITGWYTTGQLIERCYSSNPLSNVRGIRVNSINSPSWIAIMEFGAYTLSAPTNPTITANGPLTFCQGQSVTLTSSAANSYSWSNGAVTQSITVNSSGVYSVNTSQTPSCVQGSLPCTTCGPGTASVTVSVNPLPVILANAGQDVSICNGGNTILQASGGGSYLWNTNATTSSITVNPVTTTIYYVTVSDTSVTRDGSNKIKAGKTCKTLLDQGYSTGSGFYWIDPNDGSTSDAFISYCDMTTDGGGWTKITPAIPGTNTLVDLIKGSAGEQMVKCTDASTHYIISPSTSMNWSWTNKQLVPGTWNVDGTSQACGSDPEFNINIGGCGANVGWGFGCSNGGGGNNKFYGGTGDNGVCNDSVAHTNSTFSLPCTSTSSPQNSSYSIFIRSDDVSPANCSALPSTDSVKVTVNAKPTVSILRKVNPLCDSTKLNWASWSSVDGTSGAGAISSNLSVLVSKPSGGLSTTGGMFNGGVFPPQYSVPVGSTAIRNDLAGLFTFCFNVPVYNPQIAMASIGNPGNSVQINTSAPYQVIWPGVGMTYPNNITFIGTEGYTIIQFPGLHTCISFDYLQSETYCNLAFGTLDTNCQTVNSPPLCGGSADTLTAIGASSYSWFPSTGLNTTSGAIVVASPLVATKYYVVGTDANNCSGTDSILVDVVPLPNVTLTGDTLICAGDSTTLTAVGSGTYLWKPGNFTGSIISVSPSTNTTYTVVVASTSGCTDSSSIMVIVKPLPQALFNLTPVCKNEPVIYNDASTGNVSTWNWNYGDGATSALQNSTYTYATCDTFSVKLIITTIDGCIDSISKTARVYCSPIADFSSTDVCLNQVMNFIDLSSISVDSVSGWSWNFDDGSLLSPVQNAIHTYTNAGSYDVSLISTSIYGCIDTVTKNVTIHPLPDAKFNFTNVCDGSPVPFSDLSTLLAPDMIQLWEWNFGDGSPTDNNPNASHLYSSIGAYDVQLLIISSFGCLDSITQKIKVNPNPTVLFAANDTAGCDPLCVSFTDLSFISPGNNVQWNWNVGDGSPVSSSQNFDHCYTSPSDVSSAYFNVGLTVTSDSGCVSSLVKNNYIAVYPNPNADFSVQPTQTTITDPVISILNSSTGVDIWNWDFGDQQTSSISNPATHNFADTGTYIITLITSTQYGCMDSAFQTVIIEPDFVFYIPNTFSPNGDYKNDAFSGKGTYINEFEMMIFDRWGNLIYKTNDINLPWNGKVNNTGEIAQQDVYIYSFKITDIKTEVHFYRGAVTLLR